MKSMYDIFEALDFKITATHDIVNSVSKNLTVHIKLLRQTISVDTMKILMQKQEPEEESHGYQSLQARMEKHVMEQALDMASRLGMPP